MDRNERIEAEAYKAFKSRPSYVPSGDIDVLWAWVKTSVVKTFPDLTDAELGEAFGMLGERSERETALLQIIARLGERIGINPHETVAQLAARGAYMGDPVALMFENARCSGLSNDEMGVVLLHRLQEAEQTLKAKAH
jgi:hypothetical protein